MRLLKLCIVLFSGVISSQVCADAQSYLKSIQSNPNALYSFFKEMPKGGELHYHLAGGAYPETMLLLASQHNYCLDKFTLTVSKHNEQCSGIETKDIFKHPELYNSAIHSWSMKDFVPGLESRHDHFFNSFFKFMPLVADFRPQLIAEIMNRAADQHELYIELMILPDNANSTTFAKLIRDSKNYDDKKNTLLANKDFQDNVQFTINETERILNDARQELGCTQNPKLAACNLTVKFQYYILREQALDNVFAQALNAFAAASQSNLIVGINLVQAEDGIISLRDYKQQMEIISYLHKAYPNVHIALHAGEMSPSGVMPEDLRFHIHDAIYTGQAERIGHGVDVAYENQAESLLKYMASKPVPVEINLISNREILNIYGPEHPLRTYLDHNVPVVLSTDDEGILRTDLTRQYVEAIYVHQLDYAILKRINRNALTYNFLPGVSLWKNPFAQVSVAQCENLQSPSCLEFVQDNPKASLQRELELQLMEFEKQY